jgi:glycosyltransferase involved in cell wall biosynthesis
MTKFAINSHVLPPSRSGQAIVLYQLLKNHTPSDYILISNHDYTNLRKSEYFTDKLNAKYYYTRPPFQINNFLKIGKYFLFHINQIDNGMSINRFLSVRARNITELLMKENCDIIISCTADIFGPPISLLASESADIPLILYAFDQYSTQWTIPFEKAFAVKYEKIIADNARFIFVPNEFMEIKYKELYGVKPIVIHNPCDLSSYSTTTEFLPITENKLPIKILYTGSIYDAHYDAFRTLLSTISHNKKFELHVYTDQNPRILRRKGILGQVVFHSHIKTSEISKIHQGADILYLPLAFNSIYPEIVMTSSPGKMGEYLASGRPIFVHAPPDSYISWYFKTYDCGLVVDKNTPSAISEGLESLILDTALQERLVRNARKRAIMDFDLTDVRNKFFNTINSAT